MTAILLAPLGTVAVAGHQIATNFSTLMFMFPLALGMTATIRVGHCLGADKMEQARVAARTALGLSVLFALAIAVCTVAFRYGIVRIYNDDPVVTAWPRIFYSTRPAIRWWTACKPWLWASARLQRHADHQRDLFLAYWVIGLWASTLARTDWIVPAMGPAGSGSPILRR